jgi:putative ATP-binding cassette transporter
MSDRGIVAQLMCLLRALTRSRYRSRLGLLAGLLLAVVCASTFGQIKLNAWIGSFYDTLEQRSFWALGNEVLTFLVIVSGLLLLVVAQTWLLENLKIRLREWLTHDLLDNWLAPKRAHMLSNAGEVGVNPDQRMQEDARELADLSANLFGGLLQSTLLLLSFVGVLWMLSSQVVFTLEERSFSIPGYMVWCALLYALAGSWLAWLVGRPLIRLNAERCAREADLRSALVRIHESADAIAFCGGERDERRIVNGPVAGVVSLGREIARGLARLTWVTSGYGWLAIIVPILVAAPGYFGGMMSLGGLMMVVGAFNQVQQSLRWFVDNFPSIATWRATLQRVSVFRESLADLNTAPPGARQIALVRHEDDKLAFENFSIAMSDDRVGFDAPLVEIERGERVLIVTQPGWHKSKLLGAVAGLWSRGDGTILLPPARDVMFIPSRSYLPLSSLRNAVTYPAGPDAYDDFAVCAALERVGVARLAARLGDVKRWDKVLSADEQQCLILARLLLHAPQWLFFEDSTGGMDDEHFRVMRSILEGELETSSVIGCGSKPKLNGFYTRTLQLRPLSSGPQARPYREELLVRHPKAA